MSPETLKAIETAVETAFSAGVRDKRFIDVSRIPLICQSIVGIHESLKEINNKMSEDFVTQDQYWPVKTLVYGLVGAILISFLGALSLLVIK